MVPPWLGARRSAAGRRRAAIDEQYPNIAALLAMMATKDTEELFSFGVERIIDGLRSQLSGEAGS